MGISASAARFDPLDLRGLNWLAYVLEPGAPFPRLEDQDEETAALTRLIGSLSHLYRSAPTPRKGEVLKVLSRIEESFRFNNPDLDALKDLRELFRDRPWTAVLVPSGFDRSADRLICSEEFLRKLENLRPDDPGVILQPTQASDQVFALTNVFPAFRVALANSPRWPGILLWRESKHAVFIPFASERVSDIEVAATWVFSHLATAVECDPELLLDQYTREFPQTRRSSSRKLTILHLSDIHAGSDEANRRISRVQQLIRNVSEQIMGDSRLLPIVSGDLMDTPSERNLNEVRSFLDFLSSLQADPPIIVLGNHDVRSDGYLAENYKVAMRIPSGTEQVRWYDDLDVGLVCLNSVIDGRLARGYIGEQQLLDIGSVIDRKSKVDPDRFLLIAILHHHPIPVENPSWYTAPFYEKLLGRRFERTEALEDAELLLRFAGQRRIAAILHGHKHIPRAATTPSGETPIYGCGSTVGKVATKGLEIYMSINLITVDASTRHISARLLAEQIPGGGLVDIEGHEILARTEHTWRQKEAAAKEAAEEAALERRRSSLRFRHSLTFTQEAVLAELAKSGEPLGRDELESLVPVHPSRVGAALIALMKKQLVLEVVRAEGAEYSTSVKPQDLE
jgi:hypothetical protein